MSSAVAFDVETTTFQKGNPFAKRNRLCYVGAYREGGSLLADDATILPSVGREIATASPLVGFNIKFDLHWLRREGVLAYQDRRIWDCQLAHFLLSSQRARFPRLQLVCDHYGIKGKLDVVKNDYWDKGIDTPDIPKETVVEYLEQDLRCTMEVYQRQRDDFKKQPKLLNLFNLYCQDILVLEEMEWNGLKIDREGMLKQAEVIRKRLGELEEHLKKYSNGVPVNWESGDHVSAIVYGGTITLDGKELIGVYKSGIKVGQPRFKNIEVDHRFPQLCVPLPKTEVKKSKPGAELYSIDESILRQLKDKSGIVKLLLERAKLTKALDYFQGIPDLYDEMDWTNNTLHGQLNHVNAITGRLSAEKPNQQNLTGDIKEFIIA